MYTLRVVTFGRPAQPIIAQFESKEDGRRMFHLLRSHGNEALLKEVRLWKQGESRDILSFTWEG